MFKVGLTGGIGSGKSTVSAMFESLGIKVIDADLIAKAITEPGQPVVKKIIDHFGEEIADGPDKLNRKKLKSRVFSNPSEKKWLEEFLHPIILNTMQQKSEQAKSLYCLLVIPLLQETPASYHLVDRILVIDAPAHLQLQRIQTRDHLNEDEVKTILYAQASSKERLAIADDVIINDGEISKLKNHINQLHTFYLKLAQKRTAC